MNTTCGHGQQEGNQTFVQHQFSKLKQFPTLILVVYDTTRTFFKRIRMSYYERKHPGINETVKNVTFALDIKVVIWMITLQLVCASGDIWYPCRCETWRASLQQTEALNNLFLIVFCVISVMPDMVLPSWEKLQCVLSPAHPSISSKDIYDWIQI